ncbi:MAG: nucleoside kinase [Eubacteriales bacterium]|nr:nucleoside kinase [Eubacteriales bacterium]
MNKPLICVRVGDMTKTYPAGISYGEIAADFQEENQPDIVLVKADGRLQELHRQAKKDCTLEFLTVADRIGFRAYQRSMTLLMLKAVYHVAGHENIEKVGVHFAIGNGFYCTLEGKQELTEAFLEKVKAYMHSLVEQKILIEKRSVETSDAIALFRDYGMKDKEKLFHYRRVSNVNLYNLDGFEDYYYGYMVPHTGVLRQFDLCLYDEGFMLLMPRPAQPEELPVWTPREKIFYVQKESLKWGEMLEVSTVGDMNEYIVNKDAGELVLIAEALQEKKISEMAAQIARNPEKKLIMIAGPTSSGKTTFSHRLAIQLAVHGLKPHPVPVDDYFVNREDTPLDEEGKPNYECLEAIDVEKFNEDMNRLLAGEKVELPTFNFKTGKREYKGKFRQLGKDDILVIEGIHCLNDRLSYSLPRETKTKIYISALTQLNVDEHNRIPTTDGRLIRRIVRDARTRGTSAKNTIAMWPSVRRGEESYIFPYQEEADLMFNSALIYELSVLKMYAEPLLYGIGEEEPEYQEAKRLLKFMDYFVGIPDDSIPKNSILREFIGGGCFHV